MAVRIGHASIGETGKAKNNQSGDQTKKEVCIRNWYSSKWKYVLRCKDFKIANKMATICEQGCANDHIGYDQNQRNTLRTEAIKCNYNLAKIAVNCETDCSAYMSVIAECAGIKIPYHSANAPTTSTMLADFLSTGMFTYFEDSKYLTSDKHLKRGDILVSPGHHTVMVLDNGTLADANGDAEHYPLLKKGSTGYYVRLMQELLNKKGGYKLTIDGIFGMATFNALVAFQGEMQLVKDGICGEKTWQKLL